MERVEFMMKNGRTRLMAPRQAEALRKLGLGTYQTRDMARQPMIAPTLAPAQLGDGFDAMTRDELHALAKERGIVVHGSSGADKVRAALRAA